MSKQHVPEVTPSSPALEKASQDGDIVHSSGASATEKGSQDIDPFLVSFDEHDSDNPMVSLVHFCPTVDSGDSSA